jgi:Flp pilus assembly pilin Flp
MRFLSRLWEDDRGQSTTEYILILSVVVMVALKFKSSFQTRLTSMVDKLGSNIDNAMNDDGVSGQ